MHGKAATGRQHKQIETHDPASDMNTKNAIQKVFIQWALAEKRNLGQVLANNKAIISSTAYLDTAIGSLLLPFVADSFCDVKIRATVV